MVIPKLRPISRPSFRPQFRSSSGGAEHAERTRCVEGCVGGPTELHGHIRPASAGIRMSVFIDNATKRADNGLRGVLVGHRRSSQRAVEGRDVMMRCSRSVGGSNAGG